MSVARNGYHATVMVRRVLRRARAFRALSSQPSVHNNMTSNYPAVLVLGVVPSLIWPVVRCLKLAGAAPIVLAWHTLSPMRWSRDCRAYLTWPKLFKSNATLDGSALQFVREVCLRHGIEQVLAADYDTTLLLARGAGAAGIPMALLPAAETVASLNDKWILSRLLERTGLPYPDSEYIGAQAELLATRLAFPMITKPLDKWASVGFQIHRDRGALERTLADNRLSAGYPLIAQAYVPGWDAGASFLAQRGRLVAYSLAQHRVRGARNYYADPCMRAYLERFVAATDYTGIGHIDARYDPARKQYRLLELNPRFWASVLYAAKAGLNFPDLLVRLSGVGAALAPLPPTRNVRLGAYEGAMTLANRWIGIGYEKATGAVL